MAGTGALEVAAGRLEGFVRERLALPGLAVGLIGPGGWRHEFAAGVNDVASGRPLKPGALLPVASIGKVMTALALFREHEAGRLDLEAGPPLPALAAPGHPVRADHGPAPARPHRRDRHRPRRLAVAGRRSARPGPHPAGVAA